MNNIQPDQIFDVDFFIRYFERIPEDQWCVGTMENTLGQHCAAGHCGAIDGRDGLGTMAKALNELMHTHTGWGVTIINDFKAFHHHFNQPTPRARILAALREIQAKQQPRPLAPAVVVQHECCHIWLACGICMICSTTKPTEKPEAVVV